MGDGLDIGRRGFRCIAPAGLIPNDELYEVWIDNWTNAEKAHLGSLDAAKALHEAVCPNQSVRIDRRSRGWVVWLDNPHQGISQNPARAWLLAILSALIAEAGE